MTWNRWIISLKKESHAIDNLVINFNKFHLHLEFMVIYWNVKKNVFCQIRLPLKLHTFEINRKTFWCFYKFWILRPQIGTNPKSLGKYNIFFQFNDILQIGIITVLMFKASCYIFSFNILKIRHLKRLTDKSLQKRIDLVRISINQ